MCDLWGPTEKGHGAGCCHALLDVLPVGQLGVALLPRAAMELEERRPCGEGRRGRGSRGPERERERPREPGRDGLRERETERWTDGDKRWRASQRPGERRQEGGIVRNGSASGPRRPLRPKTHRDQSCPPVPQIGQQPVSQIHTLLDARAQLHGQRYVQHLWEREWSAAGPGVGR